MRNLLIIPFLLQLISCNKDSSYEERDVSKEFSLTASGESAYFEESYSGAKITFPPFGMTQTTAIAFYSIDPEDHNTQYATGGGFPLETFIPAYSLESKLYFFEYSEDIILPAALTVRGLFSSNNDFYQDLKPFRIKNLGDPYESIIDTSNWQEIPLFQHDSLNVYPNISFEIESLGYIYCIARD